MKKHIALTLILSILFLCCNNSDDTPVESANDLNCSPNYGFDIDADDDGINDFKIYCSKIYFGLTNGPQDGSLIIGISPFDSVLILNRSENGLFFLQNNDIVYSEQSLNNGYWFEETDIMLTKGFYEETGWSAVWSVNSNLQEYYLAFKLQNGTTEKIGWIKFEFDTINGEVEVIDKASTDLESIVIN